MARCALQVIVPLLMSMFAPISGAHFNPMLSVVMGITGMLVSSYIHPDCFALGFDAVPHSHQGRPSAAWLLPQRLRALSHGGEVQSSSRLYISSGHRRRMILPIGHSNEA